MASNVNPFERNVAVVTGISSGIGRSLARDLASEGVTVVGVARDLDRGRGALRDIARAPGAEVALIRMDLASNASIRAASAEIRERFPRIHMLVNNAGAILPERRITVDHIEETFAVNHVGPWLFTRCLLDALHAAPKARIVNVSSEAHRRGAFDDDDPMLSRTWSAVRAYCNAKLANLATTFELSRRLQGTSVTVNAIHPGAVATAWGDRAALPIRLAWKLARPFFLDEDEGARGPRHLLTSPALEGVSGRYFFRTREVDASALARDPALGAHLFRMNEALTDRSVRAARFTSTTSLGVGPARVVTTPAR